VAHISFFDTHSFDKEYFSKNKEYSKYKIKFYKTLLTEETAALAEGSKIVCAFVNDKLTEKTLTQLKEAGVELITLRCAGFNQVDLKTAQRLGLKVTRVPEYSPYAVAEHSVALLLTLIRKTHKAYNRVREQNFSLDGLVGFDLYQKTVGVIGTGKIGAVFCEILHGFGCKILAYDIKENDNLKKLKNLSYCELGELYKNSDILSLHVPLQDQTYHMINESALDSMKNGVVIINTSRGKLIDTKALIQALKSKKIGAAGLDVYEEEEAYFFKNFSEEIIPDDQLSRLMSFPNVLITSHQAFLTHEALTNIADTTYQNIEEFLSGKALTNEVL